MKTNNSISEIRKKNIMIVTSSLWIGGAEVVISNLSRNINKDKFNVYVCVLKEKGTLAKEIEKAGIKVLSINQHKNIFTKYLTFFELRKIIKEKKITIVNSHTTHALIESCLCKLTIFNLKVIHTFHFGNYPHYEKHYKFLEKLCAKICNSLIAVGNRQMNIIRNLYKIPDKKIKVIWNGVERIDDNESEIMNSFLNMNKIIIGTTATLIEQKGISYLLDVAKILKDKKIPVIFVIAGEGHLKDVLEHKKSDLGLDGIVYFLGWVENAAKILNHIDIFFLPSLWEAMSISVLEAMAAGKPMVLSNVGDNNYVIKNGIHGFIVEPKDVKEMTEKIKLLVSDKELRKKIGKNTKARFDRHFSVRNMTNQYENLFTEFL